jgi:hypothetical protein
LLLLLTKLPAGYSINLCPHHAASRAIEII